jgi:nucleoside-diphosphate-sugar epimerase
MIAIVTGASGFIGSHLVDALLARGATVRVLVRPESSAGRLDARVQYATADLLDVRSVREAPVWEGATHLFHLAGVTKRRTLAQFRYGNVVPTANLLSAAIANGGSAPPRVVLVSSQAAAGPARSADRPVSEDDEPDPVEAYGRSKLEAEQCVRLHGDRLAATVVRPAAVYGPRDRDFLGAFRQAVRRVAIHAAPRDHLISIVHVADLVSAILLSAERPEAVGRTYFVANETPLSWRELYRQIALAASADRVAELELPEAALSVAGLAGDLVSAVTGVHSLANHNKTVLARQRWWLCDPTRIGQELHWHPAIPLQRGVRDTYLWYVEAGWLRAPTTRAEAASSEEPQA